MDEKRFPCKVVQFIEILLLCFISALYDLPIKSYIISQLAPNYPIISIISKTKGWTKKLYLTKLLSSSKYISWFLSQPSTTFRSQVMILPQLNQLCTIRGEKPKFKIRTQVQNVFKVHKYQFQVKNRFGQTNPADLQFTPN